MTLTITILLSFLIVLGAIGAMAIGVIFGRRYIQGSCGGIGSDGCKICGSDPCLQDRPDGLQQE